jgi:transposase InsO family protein
LFKIKFQVCFLWILIWILNFVHFLLYQNFIDYPLLLITIIFYVWGPFKTSTYNGMYFFLTIVDDHSRFTWLHLMKHKSEATSLIKMFFKHVKVQFSVSIKAIRTDNAKELQLSSFLQDEGVIHQFSCPHRPQQNFVVDRKHQHLLNVARPLLFCSKVPLKFWGDCVSVAVYLINRTLPLV